MSKVEYVSQPFKMEIKGQLRTARYVYHLMPQNRLSHPDRIEYKSDNGDWLHYVENPNDPS